MTTLLWLRLPVHLVHILRLIARQRGVTLSQAIAEALEAGIAEAARDNHWPTEVQ